jgi:hypothetical protein
MFQRQRKSAPVPEPSSPSDVTDLAGRTMQLALEWREDAKRVARAYAAWCAADRRDRDHRYVSFVNALAREERAAHQLERTSALGTADPVA